MRISSLSRILNHARASGFLQEAQSADGTEQGEEEEGDAEMKEKEEEEEAEGEKEVEEEEEEEEESSSSEEDGSELGATPGYEIVAPHPHVGGGLNGFNVGIGRIEGLDSLRAAEDPAPGPQGGASGSGRAPLPVVPDVHAGRDESGSGSDERYSMGMGGASEEEEEEEVCVNCAQPMSSCRGSICADHHSLAAGDLFGEDAADMDPLPRSGFEGRAIARRITGEAARAPPTPRGTALAYDERF
ncbi:hypothetical protein T484DRAFT_1768977 [Baffinella frigidus]|nr:hypothetical protein T484DRAFT_1768977 [Cryptophyta sp. CCMP2293]